MDAMEMRAAREAVIRAAQDEHPGHEECNLGLVDDGLGLVCGCGLVFGDMRLVGKAQELRAPDTDERAPLAVAPIEKQVVAEGGLASAVNPQDPILARVDVIDPTQPYTPADVEQHLLEATARLERGAHYERICAEDYAAKVYEYEIAHAKALLDADKAGGAADVRAARAMVACEQLYVQRMVAKMKLDAVKGTMHSLRSVISSYQSVAKSVATAYQVGGGGRS